MLICTNEIERVGERSRARGSFTAAAAIVDARAGSTPRQQKWHALAEAGSVPAGSKPYHVINE